mmetsp:Transcript_21358/g.46359  ORF Transcript_21358/g.46359 Transcript_21358/m.46359 type:complete len:666 (+) Transcript_21358:107-2104(+)
MLVLGFELEDVLRVGVGIILGLLTAYRRELSCNRGYHPEDENNDSLGESIHRRLLQAGMPRDRNISSSSLHANDDDDDGNINPSRLIRRRKSSSALPNMSAYHEDDEHHHQHGTTTKDYPNNINKEDPTEELLESAGLFLSGGPFLAAAIAVFDHLFFTSFASACHGASSLLRGVRTETKVRNVNPCEEENNQQQFSESTHDGDDEAAQQQQHLYSVAWNAATEYYTSISAKLDGSTPTIISFRNNQKNNGDDGLSMLHTRSKSTGNLQQHLSDERSRALLRDMLAMANRGGMDVTLLPGDAQIGIFSYLYPQEVLAFTCTNRAGRNLLEDGVNVRGDGGNTTSAADGEDDEVEKGGIGIQINNGDTALLIWKALFRRDYSWVLSDWEIGNEAFLRSMAYREDQGLVHRHPRRQDSARACKVLHHLISTIVGTEHDANDEFPMDNMKSSMKEFYFTFAETWLNYTIAGCNSTEKCLIGLHGHVFDISNFVEHHPGSTETLLLQAGRDATVFFESMGHSLGARKLALEMCAVVNGQCCRWQFASEEGSNNVASYQLRPGPLGPLFATWGLIKPRCRTLDIKRNIVGFLTPRKRSSPRFQGGLYRIRERIRRGEEMQLADAARYAEESIGQNGMFGGIQVYYDPFCGWRWWYTDRDFNAVFATPPRS